VTNLLWLCVFALGHRMLYEVSYDLGPWHGPKVRRVLKWGAWAWVLALVWTGIWFWRQP
jgi:hypothetical protein